MQLLAAVAPNPNKVESYCWYGNVAEVGRLTGTMSQDWCVLCASDLLTAPGTSAMPSLMAEPTWTSFSDHAVQASSKK